MNERIKELAEQANSYTYSKIGEYWIGPEEIAPGWIECRDKKFAELIVTECCQVLLDKADQMLAQAPEETNYLTAGHLEACADQCTDSVEDIEKHFGVE